MKYGIIPILALGLIAAPLAAHADNGDLSQRLQTKIQPGQWQTTVKSKIQVQGTNMEMPTKTITTKKCIKKEDINIKEIATPKMKNMDCSLTKKNLSGDTFNFSLTCSGQQGKFTMNGKTVFQSKTANTMHAVMRGTIQNMPMTVTMDSTSKRLGACTEDSGDSSASGK